ncbi:magnesium and cobalt transport protein CorA [Nakamurella sp. UYEF19]|uniref:magnesium and cobalt transport protein CorA n=1 Tax=Nakamurella sp. UYEF19 TaxID=1756392 RepID=UPI003397C418
MTVINNSIYVGGRRGPVAHSLDETYDLLQKCDGLAWIGLYRPDEAEIKSVAREFNLHHLAVDDTVAAHQRPKSERYGDVLFTVLRPARYVEETGRVEFGELHVFTGANFVVTVRHAEPPDLGNVRGRLERNPDLLAQGPEAVLYTIFDQVVDEYAPVVARLQVDIDQVENQLFDGDPAVSRRIYELFREVIEMQRATQPLEGMLDGLSRGFDKYKVAEELRRRLRDVQDHTVRITEKVDGFRLLLQNALTVNGTLVGQRQNDEMRNLTEASLAQNEEVRKISEASLEQSEEVKKISSWAAIFFAPSLVAAVYGMNFDHMPELHWVVGYPLALVLMVLSSVVLYRVFKRRNRL